MDYCCTSWYSGIARVYQHKLQITQNKIARYILRLSSRDHIGQPELNLLKLLKFKDRVKQLRLNHVFNIYNAHGAAYLSQNFTRSSNVHSHRTRSSNYNYIVPRVTGIASTMPLWIGMHCHQGFRFCQPSMPLSKMLNNIWLPCL